MPSHSKLQVLQGKKTCYSPEEEWFVFENTHEAIITPAHGNEYRNCGRRARSPISPTQTYEKWKKRSFKQDISKRENMEYNEESDTDVCHAGKKLRALFLKKQTSKSGCTSEVTIYECEDSTGCPHKEKCTKAKGNKRLYVSKRFLEKRQESYKNILSEKGSVYRMIFPYTERGCRSIIYFADFATPSSRKQSHAVL